MHGAPKKATYQDVLDADPRVVAEIIDGELITSPRPAFLHATVSSLLGTDLGSAFMRGRGGPGGWWIIDEPELHFGEQIVVPDLAGWRRERMPQFPTTAFVTLAPDWICEVLSPRTASTDRIRKMRIYLAAGVTFAWLVDPDARTLEAYRADNGNWTQIAGLSDETGDDRVRVPPFDAIELELKSLWPTR